MCIKVMLISTWRVVVCMTGQNKNLKETSLNNQKCSVVEKNEWTLQDTIQAPSNIANYRRLFVTALHIAIKEKPISDFEDLIEL